MTTFAKRSLAGDPNGARRVAVVASDTGALDGRGLQVNLHDYLDLWVCGREVQWLDVGGRFSNQLLRLGSVFFV